MKKLIEIVNKFGKNNALSAKIVSASDDTVVLNVDNIEMKFSNVEKSVVSSFSEVLKTSNAVVVTVKGRKVIPMTSVQYKNSIEPRKNKTASTSAGTSLILTRKF